MSHGEERERLLRALHAAGIDAVGGQQATRRALSDFEPGSRIRLVAVGKAASAMALGAREALGDSILSALLITKYDHLEPALLDDPRFECLESAHPVPDAASLAAGKALVDFVEAVGDDEHLVALVSGGTSALVEQLDGDLTLAKLQERTDALLAGGAPIGEINRVRRGLSRLKGGRLAARLGGCRATQFLISDVPGDRPEDIGSGPLVSERVETRIIASSSIAQAAVVAEAERRGLSVVQASASLDGEVGATLERVSAVLLAENAAGGIYVWGGEPTVILPAKPGRGGRNQHLALALATRIAGCDELALLVAATDGTDGPTGDAGGLVDGTTLSRARSLGLDAEVSLTNADAGNWLEQSGALFTTGPTGTNVMDLLIAIRGPGI